MRLLARFGPDSPRSLCDGLEILARLEPDCPTGSDVHTRSRARVAADPGFAGFHRKHSKTAQFDAIAVGEGALHRAKDGIDGSLRFVARQAGTLGDPLDEILLDQAQTPFGGWSRLTCADLFRLGRRTSDVNRALGVWWAKDDSAGDGRASDRLKGRNAMSIKSDKWIRTEARDRRMIEPFSEKQVREGVISYGLSSYGYDLRVSDEFKIFTNVNSAIIDPKNFDERSFVSVQADSVIIPPNSFALAKSIEYFRIPRDVLTICVGKSTYARCGIIVNVTPFEPEWEGFVTLEISNTTPLPARVYANEGLCQILFFQSDEVCETSYADRRGKYQHQQGIVLPKL